MRGVATSGEHTLQRGELWVHGCMKRVVRARVRADKSPDTLVDEEGRFYKPLQVGGECCVHPWSQRAHRPPRAARPPSATAPLRHCPTPAQDARGEREAAFYQAVWQPPALAAPPQGCVACEPVAPWGSGPLYGPMQAEPRPEDLAALRPFVPSYCE